AVRDLLSVPPRRASDLDRVVEEERLLEDQGDALGYLLPVQVGQAPPVEADVSPVGVVEADEQMGDRRLAGSGRADQGHRLSQLRSEEHTSELQSREKLV